MALHARLFTHKILRVTKLKKWSHTTQTIERNSEKSTTACCAQTTNSTTEEDKERAADVLHADSCLQVLSSPPWSLHPLCLDVLDTAVPSCQPTLDTVTTEKLKTLEKSLTGTLFPQDYLPLVVKSVSYTTDDIMADRRNHLGHGIIYENHAVTVLREGESGLLRKSGAAKDTSLEKGLHSGRETDISVQPRSNFQRHSICDSISSCCQPDFTDCSVLGFREESGSEIVFCSQASDPNAVLHCSASDSNVPQGSGEGQKPAGEGGHGPRMDQLRAVETHFIETLPKFFKARLDYRVYHPEIVFENNFWGENQVTVGINQYAIQLTKLRALTHLKYAHVHMEVVSSACLLEEGVIRIQWRIVGLSQLKALRFWKYTAWSYNKAFREDAEWIEGISILHVNKDGLITKHRIDRMTPSEEQLSKAPSLAAKLALLFGLGTPKPSLSDCSSLLCRQ